MICLAGCPAGEITMLSLKRFQYVDGEIFLCYTSSGSEVPLHPVYAELDAVPKEE